LADAVFPGYQSIDDRRKPSLDRKQCGFPDGGPDAGEFGHPAFSVTGLAGELHRLQTAGIDDLKI
jgi:hypothetical protein